MGRYLLKALRSPKQSIGLLVNSRVFKHFASKYDLVYFGRVHAEDDDHRLIRGVSLSPVYEDNHYMVGSVNGRDVIALERTSTLRHPHHKDQVYLWWIVACPLLRKGLPHVYINGLSHKPVFYANLFIKNSSLKHHDDAYHFSKLRDQFKVYAAQDTDLDELRNIIDSGMIDMLVHALPGCDIEIIDDTVVVMAHSKKPSVHVLDGLLKAALWLADDLDSK